MRKAPLLAVLQAELAMLHELLSEERRRCERLTAAFLASTGQPQAARAVTPKAEPVEKPDPSVGRPHGM